jgi:type II secretory pathway component PulJ
MKKTIAMMLSAVLALSAVPALVHAQDKDSASEEKGQKQSRREKRREAREKKRHAREEAREKKRHAQEERDKDK